MAALRSLAAALALASATAAQADPVARWRPFVDAASARCGVPAEWIERVMRAESAGLTLLHGRPITSPAGAMGLMQLMPGTWAEMRAALGLGPDPHDPRDNIVAGTCYLRRMHDRFGYPGLFAAYNAGPARYAEYVAAGRPLPGETLTYMATVAGGSAAPKPPAAQAPRQLFFALSRVARPGADRLPAASLFVPLSVPAETR